MSELDVLDPVTMQVTYRGERLEIRPLTIGQLPKFVRIIQPVVARLGGKGVETLQADVDVDLMLDLIEQHVGPAITAAALVTGKPEVWIEDGDTADFITLVMAIVEINRDFFAKRLAPQLQALKSRNGGAGPTASSSSSHAATH